MDLEEYSNFQYDTELIYDVQTRLKRLGLFRVIPDGQWNRATRSALEELARLTYCPPTLCFDSAHEILGRQAMVSCLPNDRRLFKILKRILGSEDPHPHLHKGYSVKYGISSETYNYYRKINNRPIQSVDCINIYELMDIYATLFWEKIGGDRLPMNLDFILMDTAIHFSPKEAIEILQALMNTERTGVWDQVLESLVLSVLDITGLCIQVVSKRSYLREESDYEGKISDARLLKVLRKQDQKIRLY